MHKTTCTLEILLHYRVSAKISSSLQHFFRVTTQGPHLAHYNFKSAFTSQFILWLAHSVGLGSTHEKNS